MSNDIADTIMSMLDGLTLDEKLEATGTAMGDIIARKPDNEKRVTIDATCAKMRAHIEMLASSRSRDPNKHAAYIDSCIAKVRKHMCAAAGVPETLPN